MFEPVFAYPILRYDVSSTDTPKRVRPGVLSQALSYCRAVDFIFVACRMHSRWVSFLQFTDANRFLFLTR